MHERATCRRLRQNGLTKRFSSPSYSLKQKQQANMTNPTDKTFVESVKDTVNDVLHPPPKSFSENVKEKFDGAVDYVSGKSHEADNAAKNGFENTKQATGDAVDATKKATSDAVDATKQKTSDIYEAAKK
jgi:hypothetical protein